MANIKSQIKRNRQNEKRRQRNRVARGEARTMVKNARAAIEEGNAVDSKKAVLEAIVALDVASQKGVIHKNNAARRKSRLVRTLANMKAVEAAPAPVIAEPAEVAAPVAEKPKRTSRAKKVEEPAAAEVKVAEPKTTKAKKTTKAADEKVSEPKTKKTATKTTKTAK